MSPKKVFPRRPSPNPRDGIEVPGLLQSRVYRPCPTTARANQRRDYSGKPPSSTDKPLSRHPALPAGHISGGEPEPLAVVVSHGLPGVSLQRGERYQKPFTTLTVSRAIPPHLARLYMRQTQSNRGWEAGYWPHGLAHLQGRDGFGVPPADLG